MTEIEGLHAEELMQTEVPIVELEATVREAAKVMASRGHGTIKDIVQLLGDVSVSTVDEFRMRDVMSRPVISVSISESVVDCDVLRHIAQ